MPDLATNARIATSGAIYGICGKLITPGSREARLPDGT